jgi:two-component system, chemotaxis family, chemotaxis protein CheY
MPSVLVIDDEERIRILIREVLEPAGYVVEEACGGKEGLERYRAHQADVVLMDILMPDQDGLESMATLHREFPSSRVIAMTGGGDMIGILNFLDVAKMLGASRTLQKPFDVHVLLEAVAAEAALSSVRTIPSPH